MANLNVLLVAGAAVDAVALAPGLLVEAASPSVAAFRMSALGAVSGQGCLRLWQFKSNLELRRHGS